MSDPLSLLLVAFFLFMNGFFVVAEFALVRVRKSQLQISADEGLSGAESAIKVAENVNAYLSACQLGITIASLALGWLGEPAVSHLLHPLFDLMGLSPAASSAVSVAVGFIVITALHIVIGELIPKSLAIFSTEKYARLTAFALICFYRLTAPVMWLFNSTTNLVMKLLGHDVHNEHEAYTSDEIRLLIYESTESGLIDPEQNEIVDNVFELYSRDVASIMTPRTVVVCLDRELSAEENMKIVRDNKFTRYPVCTGDKDHIDGFIHIKDIFFNESKGSYENIDTINGLPLRPLAAVPETLPVIKLLEIMREKETKIIMVVDEYGGTMGIVTISDIMDHLMGTMDDEHIKNRKNRIIASGENSSIIHGSLSIDNLEEIIGFIPDEADDCDTAAGLILNVFGAIPQEGESVSIADNDRQITFTVLSMNGLTIEEIEVKITSCQM